MTLETLIMAVLALIACTIAGWREWRYRTLERPDTQAFASKEKKLLGEIDELKRKQRSLESEISSLSLDVTELYEFVDRNMKKMASRNQRAEQLAQFVEEARKIEEPENEQTNMFPNSRPRIVRKS